MLTGRVFALLPCVDDVDLVYFPSLLFRSRWQQAYSVPTDLLTIQIWQFSQYSTFGDATATYTMLYRDFILSQRIETPKLAKIITWSVVLYLFYSVRYSVRKASVLLHESVIAQ